MCSSSPPKAPNTPAITPVIQPSQAISDQSQLDSDRERRRLQSIAGQQSTILTGTGASAAERPTSSYKTLIGS